MKKLFLTLMLSLLLANSAFAAVKVVATLPWIGSLAKEIGGDRVEVATLIKPSQDPHYAEAKPSMILAARKADILIYTGLDLEIGYLPRIIESANNPKIQPGRPGSLDCSRFVETIERSSSVDRGMGDVHPLGNPHYHFSPKNIAGVVDGIAEALSGIDAGNSTLYQANLQSFRARMKEKEREWSSKQLKGKKYVAYHRLLEYLAREYGFEIAGYIEPKPGIPPSAAHIAGMVQTIKKTRPHAIVSTEIAGKKEAASLSQMTGVKAVIVPHDVGATASTRDWFSLIDEVVKALE